MPILNEPSTKVKFSFLEKEIYRRMCELGCNILKEAIEEQSEQINQAVTKKSTVTKGNEKAVSRPSWGRLNIAGMFTKWLTKPGRVLVYTFWING